MVSRTTAGRLPVGPLLLVLLGVLLLLSNLGLVSWQIWRSVAALWPLVIVLIGLQGLLTGRVDWGSLVVLLFAFALISLASHLFVPAARLAGPIEASTTQLRQDLGQAQRASVDVTYGGGDLVISGGAEPGLLASGELASAHGARLETEFRTQNGSARLEIRPRLPESEDGHALLGAGSGERLTLNLTGAVPLDLEVEAGATNARVDLRELTIPTLRFSTGAANSHLILPARGVTRAELHAGAAALVIEVPPGVAARIRTSGSGLSRFEVDQSRFQPVEGGYQTEGFDSAQDRVDLLLQTGLASVEIR